MGGCLVYTTNERDTYLRSVWSTLILSGEKAIITCSVAVISEVMLRFE